MRFLRSDSRRDASVLDSADEVDEQRAVSDVCCVISVETESTVCDDT
ncbi:hypothetical protein HSB1_15520 [Halogranum salarium B-1]|uniref:Uncharacterized protein n=1 Tax=Halogranum salarium B-1 TaxID=1210908 RepID=J3JHF5_9EURY|nr:hypothetical protein HSB1_15520 [Halogranum salarium B-1]